MKPFWILVFIFWRATVLVALAKRVEPCCWSCLFWTHNICRFYFNLYYSIEVIVTEGSGIAWIGCTRGQKRNLCLQHFFSQQKVLTSKKVLALIRRIFLSQKLIDSKFLTYASYLSYFRIFRICYCLDFYFFTWSFVPTPPLLPLKFCARGSHPLPPTLRHRLKGSMAWQILLTSHFGLLSS